MKTNNIDFLKNFEKKQSIINNENIRKKLKQPKQSKFEKINWNIMSNPYKIRSLILVHGQKCHHIGSILK